ncbi:hypothetical protein ACVWZZ_002865 [Bradyrhizobium sp. LM6.10]
MARGAVPTFFFAAQSVSTLHFAHHMATGADAPRHASKTSRVVAGPAP